MLFELQQQRNRQMDKPAVIVKHDWCSIHKQTNKQTDGQTSSESFTPHPSALQSHHMHPLGKKIAKALTLAQHLQG